MGRRNGTTRRLRKRSSASSRGWLVPSLILTALVTQEQEQPDEPDQGYQHDDHEGPGFKKATHGRFPSWRHVTRSGRQDTLRRSPSADGRNTVPPKTACGAGFGKSSTLPGSRWQ